MREQTRFQDLLGRLLDDDCSPAERDELAVLCRDRPDRIEQLRSLLELDQLIAQNVASNRCEEAFAEDMTLSLGALAEGAESLADFDELASRFLDSSLRPREARRLHWMCLRDPEKTRELRESLEFTDLLSQVMSGSRNEEGFVDSLVTRMWAEAASDHFVDDFASKIVAIGSLKGELGGIAEGPAGRAAVLPFPPKKMPHPARKSAHSWGRTIAFAAAAAVAGALVVLALVRAGVGFGSGDGFSGALANGGVAVDSGEKPTTAVAVISESSSDVQWSAASQAAIGADGEVEVGRYELASGVVRVRFSSGAEMTVEGPAEFEVRSDREAYVHSGLALARAEKPGDLQVRSKGFELVDVEKTFAVDARFEGFTEAVFFDGVGQVQMISADGAGGAATASSLHGTRNLYAFETVRADHARDRLVDVPYNPSVFSRTWQLISGVESNSSSVEVELPGSVVIPRHDSPDRVQVFLEKDGFVATEGLVVDLLTPGKFTSLADVGSGEAADGIEILPEGELRSYLLQRWAPQRKGTTLEASVTFSEPVVGVIFSSDKLARSDEMVGADLRAIETAMNEAGSVDAAGAQGGERQMLSRASSRGLDRGDGGGSEKDQILLSADGRTLNVVLHGGNDDALDHIRVLVSRH